MFLQGKGVSEGLAMGVLRFIGHEVAGLHKTDISKGPEIETQRFGLARDTATLQLQKMIENTDGNLGKEAVELFETHVMMLTDPDFTDAVTAILQTGKASAEYAVEQVVSRFASEFSAMDTAYMQGRASDIRDIGSRLIATLTGENDSLSKERVPFILAADDIYPSELARFDKHLVKAIAMRQGTPTAHTAIFAQMMGIPAVILLGDSFADSLDGHQVLVDGRLGRVVVDPEQNESAAFVRQIEQMNDMFRELETCRGKRTVTQNGKTMQLFANIGNVSDIDLVLKNDAEGIGLFRSEFLYLQGANYPDEEQQFLVYRQVLQGMKGKPVTLRTMDIGADKSVGYFHLSKEENPALGMRAIRICLTRPELFATQLRAAYRASVFGNLSIMFPMIITVEEVRECKRLIDEVKESLAKEGIAFDDAVKVGIMIETPASVIMSDELAKEVDFFSIGTNDLTQYTLACDRQNADVARFADPHDEAILRSIEKTVDNAHAQHIPVSICGVLGADQTLTEWFLEIGVDKLSVSPAEVLPLRKLIRSLP